jgi:hypothetical protein
MHKPVCHVLSEEEILLEDKIQWIGKSVQYSLWSNKKNMKPGLHQSIKNLG